MAKTKTITTAIVYPNSRIHIGWAWECIGSDWLARASRMLGDEVFFVTGMDEHALKVQKAAEAKGLTPQAYCDQMSVDIQKVLKGIGIEYDRFIRTSDEDHVRVVTKLIEKVKEKGDLYQEKYEGHYCEGCEAYYTEKDLLPGGICPQHQKPTKWISEENWFFRLSKYQDALLKLYRENPDFLQPESRRNEIVNFIESGLKDFSVSRSSFTWGIPLPWDPKHIVYVWFDALLNYITACGAEDWLKDPSAPAAGKFLDRWPAHVHIIGKDVARFHGIYWPAMLLSLGIPLPERVFSHGFLQLKGERMSKSSGNMVTPDQVVATTGGMDPLRYYLLSENDFSQDATFSWEGLQAKCNADLANDWGNLVNRTISMARKYFPGTGLKVSAKPTVSADVALSFSKLVPELRGFVDRIDTQGYVRACTQRSRELNLFIDQMKPWSLAKLADAGDENARAKLEETMAALLEGIRFTAAALLPVLPERMPDAFRQLGVPIPKAKSGLKSLQWGETPIQPDAPVPLYPRIELPDILT